ncbi:hypothetical protein GGX14DRAFT_701605 [Mycena pura]|uniref:Uncharacterized protein n=1 Tax=Mycena pura TaxID=153505 RepID=A0AAD6UP02_9AGAR|nr:hypothetical protein GGX14DRAFT_701605 [Mycena pura]
MPHPPPAVMTPFTTPNGNRCPHCVNQLTVKVAKTGDKPNLRYIRRACPPHAYTSSNIRRPRTAAARVLPPPIAYCFPLAARHTLSAARRSPPAACLLYSAHTVHMPAARCVLPTARFRCTRPASCKTRRLRVVKVPLPKARCTCARHPLDAAQTTRCMRVQDQRHATRPLPDSRIGSRCSRPAARCPCPVGCCPASQGPSPPDALTAHDCSPFFF